MLTEDTAALRKLARRLVQAGAPVCEVQQALAAGAGAGACDIGAEAAQVYAEIESQLAGLPLEPGLARGWLVGLLHEQALAREQRRRQGAYYTPRGIANYMLRRALAVLGAAPATQVEAKQQHEAAPVLRVLDPAAGGGAFLLSALEVWRERSAHAGAAQGGARLELTGLDLDVAALDSARLALVAAGAAARSEIRYQLVALDSLLAEPTPDAGVYDIVAGNPPYLDSERLTRQQPGLRAELRARFRTARGNWDLSCVFVERALELARPGGVIAMLVPRKLLAADYAAALHELLLEHELVEACDLAGLPVFQAGVQAAVLLVRKRGTAQRTASYTLHIYHGMPAVQAQPVLCRSVAAGFAADQQAAPELLRTLPPGYLCAAFTPGAERIARALAEFAPLAQYASVGDGCSTAEAYQLVALVRDAAAGEGPRLVNTGLIKPYTMLWGVRELVYLKQRYRYPRLDAARLAVEYPRRWRQACAPKLLLPGLARELWAAVDGAGGCVCGKGAVQVIPHEDGAGAAGAMDAAVDANDAAGLPLLAWLAWLNSASVRELYRALFGGRGFGEGSLHIGPRQLARLPVPLAGLAEHAQELVCLAEALACEQQARWEAVSSFSGRPVQRRTAIEWQDTAAARRIDALVRAAYGWPGPN
jgi:hypothetical protein